MRISDWSSDVCSSDLSSGAAGQDHARLAHFPDGGTRRGHILRQSDTARPMTRKPLLSAAMALALAAPIASPVMAQQTLNVRDADIRAFIQDAARVTGRTFIIDNRVSGKVSVVTDRPLSRSEY